MIREATHLDALQIANIHNFYVLHTMAASEVDPVTPQQMTERMRISQRMGPYLVCVEDGEVFGYASISPFRGGGIRGGPVQSEIYIMNGFQGRGLGSLLYAELLSKVLSNYDTVISGISLLNDAGVKFHEKHGFKQIEYFSEVGRKFGQWIDVGFWQKGTAR